MKIESKIRKARKDMGLSLEQFHERLVQEYGDNALSYRTIQRIENGEISKFSSLVKIGNALNIPMNELVKDTQYEEQIIIKRKYRLNQFVYNDRVTADVVSSPSSNSLSLEVTFKPSSKTLIEQSPLDGNDYEKWVYVVQGKLTCVVSNKQYELAKGDTLTFDSTIPHYFENKGNFKCICIINQNPKHY